MQAAQNSHRGEIKKMQDLLKMMQEQLEALQANRSGPVPTKVRRTRHSTAFRKLCLSLTAAAAGGCGNAENIHHHPQRPEHGVRNHGAAAARDSSVGDAAGAPACRMQLQCCAVAAARLNAVRAPVSRPSAAGVRAARNNTGEEHGRSA